MPLGRRSKRAIYLLGVALCLTALTSSLASAAENRDAVVIGNKNYVGDRIPDVDFAHRDAEAFKRYLTRVLGYREGNIIDLRDATQAKMVAALGNERTHRGKLWQYVRAGRSHAILRQDAEMGITRPSKLRGSRFNSRTASPVRGMVLG